MRAYSLIQQVASAVVGEKLRVLMCGGALLSEGVHDFVQIAMAVRVRQAYGLTETLAGGATQLYNQYRTGTVGSVSPACEIRLVEWSEGGYRLSDRPYPRGEIWIGGQSVCMGYVDMC
jgi:long-chain acyl-CoA synthetase